MRLCPPPKGLPRPRSNPRSTRWTSYCTKATRLAAWSRGTLKCLAAPKIVVVPGRQASFLSGGSQPLPEAGWEDVNIGYTVRVTPTATDAGDIHLKVDLEHTAVMDRTADSAEIRTDRFGYTKTVKPGETIKLRMGKSSDKQTWVEMTVHPLP